MSNPIVAAFHAAVQQRAISSELARAGWTGEQAMFAKSAADHADKHGMPQRICGLMFVALNSAGHQNKQASIAYGRLARLPEWDHAFDPLLDVAYEVLAEQHLKSAADLGTAVATMMPRFNNILLAAMQGSQSAIATLASISVLGGAGLGTLNWHLGRQMSDDDEDNAALSGKIKVLREQNSALRAPVV